MFGRREVLEAKSVDQIRSMRRAGLVVQSALAAVQQQARAGMAIIELDELARSVILSKGATPSFPGVPGYRHTLCVSVNEAVVHGIPSNTLLAEGDLVSVDCGAILDGWHGDSAVTFIVGGKASASEQSLALMDSTESSLWAGIAALKVGGVLNDVGGAIEDEVDRLSDLHDLDLSIVDGYTGHGIGREMHMAPDVYNYRIKGRTPKICEGATIAIEPMVAVGSAETVVLGDGWTVVTRDGGLAAHWEHTVAVTSAGVWVLTAEDGGKSRLESMGVRFGGLD
ncbi:type I methionyl aminopeptidase [Austwickia chelonae]|uniref:type I methionyl aminopeptidase n=1 Tax=Austwickia chelonae TaxID=100225 RepID=UPI000E2569CD|nr:type I methionyl aminopeptidase [Austwickia chelonae]